MRWDLYFGPTRNQRQRMHMSSWYIWPNVLRTWTNFWTMIIFSLYKQVNRRNKNLPPIPRCQASTTIFGGATTTAASAKLVVQNSLLDKLTPPRKPMFDNNYRLTYKEREVTVFTQMSHNPVDVAQTRDYVLIATCQLGIFSTIRWGHMLQSLWELVAYNINPSFASY
jgi:hypothetical protein